MDHWFLCCFSLVLFYWIWNFDAMESTNVCLRQSIQNRKKAEQISWKCSFSQIDSSWKRSNHNLNAANKKKLQLKLKESEVIKQLKFWYLNYNTILFKYYRLHYFILILSTWLLATEHIKCLDDILTTVEF